MKRFITLWAALFALAGAGAQTAEVFRSEFVPFDTRDDAALLRRGNIAHYETFSPQIVVQQADTTTVGQVVEVPLLLTDRDIYLHLENVGSAYTLLVNDTRVADVEDDRTPREFLISPYIRPGRNAVMLDLRPSKTPQLQADAPAPRLAYANSYLVFQHRLHIDDYSVALVPDSTRKYGVLKLDIVVENSYNGEEPITAGYDIYDPKGKLLDYGSREIMVEGRSRDTVHIERLIYHAYANQWDDKRQPLYKVTLYTKRNSMLWEYIPLYVGFGESEYRDGRFYRFDKELSLRPPTLQRRSRREDDRRRDEGAQSPGHQHPAARLSAALLVLYAGRPHGVLRGRLRGNLRPRRARRPLGRRHSVERPASDRRVSRPREGDVPPFAQPHLDHRLRAGTRFGQRIQYV